MDSNLQEFGKFGERKKKAGQIEPDLKNTVWAETAGFGSIRLNDGYFAMQNS